MRTLVLVAVALVASAAEAAPTRQCQDTCLVSARAEAKDCTSSASGAFTTALDGCIEREHTCVDACRETRQECRDGSSLGTDLAQCDVTLDVARARCDATYRPPSRRWIVCVGRARIDGFRCRRQAFRGNRRQLIGCDKAFKSCTDACLPGEPPDGVGQCRSEARSAFRSTVADCRQAYQVTASACIDKDLTCTQTCIDARSTCNQPTQAALNTALAACASTLTAAVDTCVATNPSGSPELQQCITTAEANAFTCRDDAIAASGPGFAACGNQYIRCVHACPSPS
ncbi:MAG TPA: hypothetical protein VMS22_26615 [Candidatus Eisenbacteria bacterium]|nr:hypothetical protein [Candidatus Eisenbacteria bacterium]